MAHPPGENPGSATDHLCNFKIWLSHSVSGFYHLHVWLPGCLSGCFNVLLSLFFPTVCLYVHVWLSDCLPTCLDVLLSLISVFIHCFSYCSYCLSMSICLIVSLSCYYCYFYCLSTVKCLSKLLSGGLFYFVYLSICLINM